MQDKGALGPSEPAALSSDRFEVRRRVGAGGMGVVYEAFDRFRGTVVALKTLRELDAAALYRFKNEFRSLADLVHPNLVTLYELMSLNNEWVFTMELVTGVHFIEHVRPSIPGEAEDHPPTEDETLRLSPQETTERPRASLRRGRRAPVRVDLLRDALLQLAHGVSALHQAGKLHRDIKPTNVLVTAEKRVVLCDFGLITAYERDPHGRTLTSDGAGTPVYMSPEQGLGLQLYEASDWYSVGIILYEALTGRLPFDGDPADVLQRKRLLRPPPPSDYARDIPPDLEALCMDLLWPDPSRRLSGTAIFERLGVKPPLARTGGLRELPFVGRDTELALLRDAFRASRQRAQVVLLNGPSGMGKTALIQHFLSELRRSGEAVVLASRCYESEAMPYKAVDGLIDALTAHLLKLPREEVDALLPPDALALARLFPVLKRVDAVTAPLTRHFENPDAPGMRRRAFAALRDLLHALAKQHALVLCVDDLQWGDTDSAALFTELLREPAAPPLLFLATHRREDVGEPGSLVRALREAVGRGAGWELPLQPFTPDEGLRLARVLVPDDPRAAEAIVAEANGHPFWLQELARFRASGAPPGEQGSTTLDGMLRARLAHLTVPARALLNVIATAGRPIGRALAAHVAQIGEQETGAMVLLRSQRLVRGGGEASREQLEPYHDRIREVAWAALSLEERRELHRRLALGLEVLGDPDPEQSVQHWLAAGEPERALVYAERAAAQAARALAFDRASRLYRLALELTPPAAAGGFVLRRELGHSLANAGRGMEAAEAYQRAGAQAPPDEVLELRRRAGEQLLHSGQVDRGVAELQQVLAGMGLRVPAKPNAAILSFLWGRARLALRGLSFTERPESELDPIALQRIDLCWSVYAGMSFVNWILGAAFHTHQLRLALDAGEPKRLARALATEASVVAALNPRHSPRAMALHDRARELAERVGDPYTLGVLHGTLGFIHYFQGHWAESGSLSERSAAVFRNECTGVAWELDNAELFASLCLLMRGQVTQLRERVPRLMAEAEARGDIYALGNLRTQLGYFLALTNGDAVEARSQAQEALRSWNVEGFSFTRYFQRVAESQIDLYEGNVSSARDRLVEAWPALVRNQALRVPLVRVTALAWRAAAAVGALSQAGANSGALELEAEHFAKRLARENVGWSDGFAHLVEGALAHRRRTPSAALSHLERAAAAFDAHEMKMYAAVARWQHGEIQGGENGRAERDAADAWMRAQSVQVPARLVAMCAPGFEG